MFLSKSRMMQQLAVAVVMVALFAQLQTTQAQTDPLPLPEPSFGLSSNVPSTTTAKTAIEGESRACVTNTKATQLAWFYKPPNDYTTKKLSKKFDTFVLGRDDEPMIPEIGLKSDGPVLLYTKYDALHDACHQAELPIGTPCSCDQPLLENSVGWFADDICTIRDEHPDWFLRGANGEVLYFQNHVIMDVGNAGWRTFWSTRITSAMADGWDGVFIDNLDTTFSLHGSNPDIVLQDYTREEHHDAVNSFFEYQQTNTMNVLGKQMYANFSSTWGENSIYFRYLQQLDGTQDEFWAVPREGYYTKLSWEDRLLRMAEAAKRGKQVILVSLGGREVYERQQFALASYLLIAGDNVFFRYSNQANYRDVWMYDNYNLPLGEPLGEYTVKEGIKWKRKFTNGKVKVDPEARTSKIKVYDEDGIVCQ